MPFFSIIIPLYNKEAFIKATLQSVLSQTFTDFEVIIINDGSTDNSEGVVKQFTDKRIRYYYTKNQKVSKARNTAIELATGKIVAFLDADDYWEPNHLQTLFKLHRKYPEAGLLFSRYYIKIGGGVLNKPTFLNIAEDYEGIVEDPFKSSLQNRLSQPSAVAVCKDVFSKVGTFEESLSQMEDIDLWIRIVIAYPMAISSNYTAVYNFDVPNSLSRVKMRERNVFDFNKYAEQEKYNSSLKAFVDAYRVEYALRFRIEGNIASSRFLYKAASQKNISLKTKMLFLLPPALLRPLLQLKHWLHRKGISFSVYN